MNNLIPFGNLAAQISRRDFLRLCGLGFLGLSLPEKLIEETLLSAPADKNDLRLGRVTKPGQKIFEEPFPESRILKAPTVDSVLEIKNVIPDGEQPSSHRFWFELKDQGFISSAYIQPVSNRENKPSTKILGEGCLGEITIPFVDSYSYTNKQSSLVYRLYYASTYWVLSSHNDNSGNVWYMLLDDRTYGTFFVPAVAVRLVPNSELLPISPTLSWEEKKIEVDLSTQKMAAYEGDRLVFTSRISSGVRTSEGGVSTPKGYFRTTLKRPCRHMAYPGDENFSGYDLPGVPWVSYFTSNGVAFHGAYWHNDFGVPHSHGCINMTPEAAKWVYLWTTPAVLPGKYFYSNDHGTRVIIK